MAEESRIARDIIVLPNEVCKMLYLRIIKLLKQNHLLFRQNAQFKMPCNLIKLFQLTHWRVNQMKGLCRDH